MTTVSAGTVLRILLQGPKYVLSSIRHPELTPSARLLTGDSVGKELMMWVRLRRLGFGSHINLLWEAHSMHGPNETTIRWQIPKFWHSEEVRFSSGFASIPWWKSTAELNCIVDASILDEHKWLSFAGAVFPYLGRLISEDTLWARLDSLHQLYVHHFTTPNISLGEASSRMYRDLVSRMLGKSYLTRRPPVSSMNISSSFTHDILASWGKERFEAAMASVCSSGDKNLFLGTLDGDPFQLSYIGWSPKGKWLKVVASAVDGRPITKGGVVEFSTILELLKQNQIMAIGKASMVLFLANSQIVHHGLEYGIGEEIAALGHRMGISLTDQRDSWAPLKLEHDGVTVSPNLHELYLLFGEKSAYLRAVVDRSIKSGKTVNTSLENALQSADGG
jgi:hypothetical protein